MTRRPSRWRRALRWTLLGWLALCGVGALWPAPPPRPEAPARVLCASLPSPLGAVAVHCWFVLEGHERWDVWQEADVGPVAYDHVHRDLQPPEAGVGGGATFEWAALDGSAGTAFAACLRVEAPRYADRATYRAWPGPNSNTFVDAMLRQCGWSLRLPGTAVGKDWRGLVGASTWGLGVQVESPLFGAAVGLDRGFELRVLELTLGVELWPPAIVHPFGGGRLGFPRR